MRYITSVISLYADYETDPSSHLGSSDVHQPAAARVEMKRDPLNANGGGSRSRGLSSAATAALNPNETMDLRKSVAVTGALSKIPYRDADDVTESIAKETLEARDAFKVRESFRSNIQPARHSSPPSKDRGLKTAL